MAPAGSLGACHQQRPHGPAAMMMPRPSRLPRLLLLLLTQHLIVHLCLLLLSTAITGAAAAALQPASSSDTSATAFQLENRHLLQHRHQQHQRQQQQHHRRAVEVPSTVPLGKDIITPPRLEDAFPHLPTLQAACPPDSVTPMVVAMAANTPPHKVCPFVRSWHMHSPTTHVLILTDSPLQRTAIMGSTHSVPNVHVLLVKTRPQEGTEWHMWRYFLYRMVLEVCGQIRPLPPVMLSDVRDALALADVWRHPMVRDAVADQTVIFSMEGHPGNDGIMHMAQAIDGGWSSNGLHACFDGLDEGTLHASSLMHYGYTCSGVTLGGGQAMLNYTRAMEHAMLHMSSARCWSYHGGDQMVHMWLLSLVLNATKPWAAALLDAHPQLQLRAVATMNGEGPVYTAGLALPIHMDMFGGVMVLRHNYSFRPSYLHQYDRDTMVGREVFLLYPCALTPSNWFGGMWAYVLRLKSAHQVVVMVGVFVGSVVVTTLAVLQVTVGLGALHVPWLGHSGGAGRSLWRTKM